MVCSKRKSMAILTAALLWALSTPWLVDAVCPCSIPKEAKALMGSTPVRTLTADFVQQRTLSVMSTPLESQGRLFFQSPDSVVWEVTSPAQTRLVIHQGRALMEMPGVKYTSVVDTASNPLMKDLVDHIASIASQNLERLAERYTIVFEPPTGIRLVPREERIEKAVSSIRIDFSSPQIIRTIEMRHPNGDRLEIRFTNVRINPSLSDGLFDIPDTKTP